MLGCLIIGGGLAGLTAAIYLPRSDAELEASEMMTLLREEDGTFIAASGGRTVRAARQATACNTRPRWRAASQMGRR